MTAAQTLPELIDIAIIDDRIVDEAEDFHIDGIDHEIKKLVRVNHDGDVRSSKFSIRYTGAANAVVFSPLYRYEGEACVKALFNRQNDWYYNQDEAEDDRYYEDHELDVNFIATRMTGQDRREGDDLIVLYDIESA